MSTVLFAVSTSVYLLALARIVQVVASSIIITIIIIIIIITTIITIIIIIIIIIITTTTTTIITIPTRVYPLLPTSPPAKQCSHTLSRENLSVLFLEALQGE